MPKAMTLSDWGLLFSLSLLWGGSFFFAGVALRELPPLTLVALRVGVAALVLNLALPALGLRMPRERRILAAFLGMGLLNNALPFSLIVWGQTHIASGLAAILNATTPLWTVLLAHRLARGEKLTAPRFAGAAAGLAGVAVMIGPPVLSDLGADALAELAVLAAAVSYALAGLYGRRFGAMGLAPLVTATGQVSAATLLLLPVALVVDRPWQLPVPTLPTLASVLGLALLSTALAYALYFRLLARVGATNLLLVTFLIPVSAILLGSLVLHERLTPRHFLGMALIGAGLAAIGRSRPMPRPPARLD
jgi:drug/metabolite transporter (DMT)-like permease